MFKIMMLLIGLSCLLSPTEARADPKTIGFVVTAEHGHFAPMAGIIEQLLERGHHVHLYMVSMSSGSYLDCKVVESFSPPPGCHRVGMYNSTHITPEFVTEIVKKSAIAGLAEIAKHINIMNQILVTGMMEHLQAEGAKLDALVIDWVQWQSMSGMH